VGTYVTAYTAQNQTGLITSSPLELVFAFAAIGAGLSVAVNWVVLKAALRPLDGITRAVEEVRKGNLRARAARDPFSDPQIETLRETLNAMLDRLDEHGTRLLALSSQIIKAQEEERLRIARELHDETAQALASLLVRQRVAERSPDAASLQRTMADLRVLTSEALEGVRRMALELRPTMLDDLGLVAALEAYTEAYGARMPLAVHFSADGFEDRRVAPQAELVLYRVVQEALTNAAKHADARHVRVELRRRPDEVVAMVEDDGRGFDVEETMRSRERGLGLFGMQERMALVQGELLIDSAPGRGTRIDARVPMGLT
jgi:two-component system sensor histidine kinase UhpB